MCSYKERLDRYKNMQYGEFIDGEFVEYEDMTEEQLMELHAFETVEWQKECQAIWLDTLEE